MGQGWVEQSFGIKNVSLSKMITFNRTHSVILVSTEDQALFYEKTMENVDNWQPENWIENCFEFPLESKKN